MKFYKIITANITAETKLRLPNKFVERHGAVVPRSMMLRVPTGAEWRVGVKIDKNGTWLGNGLYKFAESLGIEYGHFLVFDYDGMHAVFHVVAIDMSATEIKYPAMNCNGSEEDEDQGGLHSSFATELDPKVKEDNDEDEVVIVNKVDWTVGRKRSIEASQSLSNEPARKKAKAGNSRNCEHVEKMYGKSPTDSETVDHTTTIKRGSYGTETILDGEGRIWKVVQGRRSGNQINNAQTEKALQRARDFKADEPVCIITLSPSYVLTQEPNGAAKKNCQLTFPLSFIKAYINLEIQKLKLRTKDGMRTWSVNYRLKKDKPASVLTSGWRQFAIDNDLKFGEVCLFELIKGAENALKVVIFRISDEEEALK